MKMSEQNETKIMMANKRLDQMREDFIELMKMYKESNETDLVSLKLAEGLEEAMKIFNDSICRAQLTAWRSEIQ